MTAPSARSVVVGVGIGEYGHLRRLDRAVADIEDVAQRLKHDGFVATTITDQPREAVVRELTAALPRDALTRPGSVLVVLWAGHASPSADTGSLRLFTHESRSDDFDALALTAEQLAQVAAASGAAQVLLLLDTCRAGAAVVDMARVIDAVGRKLVDRSHRWVGVVASCQDYERAVDGVLARKLLDLLDRGPVERTLRLRWSSYQAGLRGDDLVDALVKEWEEDRQAPKPLLMGDPWLIMPNPLYRPGAPEQVVEHLLWAARGGSQEERGFWFTGRVRPLGAAVAWLRDRQPGVCLVTGPAGCGKSAVAGRIVSLSSPTERELIREARMLPPPDLDPGEGSVSAHVQARGLKLERCAELLAGALCIIGVGASPNHHDVLAWASNAPEPPVLVVDGLDEAGDEGFRIATDLLAPLSRYALVIVASRELPGPDETSLTLLGSLGPAALRIDLEEDPAETDRDVRDYVVARLTDPDGRRLDERMEPAVVADAVVRLARGPQRDVEGPFLLARILTSQLIAEPTDTSQEDWQDRLAVSVQDAFDRDLSRGRPLTRDGEPLPDAARELLTALAFSYGSGFPADDVWPAVASALSPTSTEYGRLDAIWALDEYGRYVTASGIGGQAVYRLHQGLADTLRRGFGSASSQPPEETGATVASAVLSGYQAFLAGGGEPAEHRYLWHYAWAHAADGGPAAIEALEQLAAEHPSLEPDVAMASTVLADHYGRMGRRADAVVPTERAIAIYERLAAENPAFLNDLAGALNNLGVRYSEVGRRADAIPPTERAVDIRKRLAAKNPAILNDLAISLNNLGICYSEVGRRFDAVAPTERAVDICERLSAENPAFLNDLASTLNNLGNRYSEVGQRADAVAPTQRAVDICERLAGESPAFLSDLASALNNLGIRYSEVGQRTDAIGPTQRAVEIYERLAAESPAFLNDLASALNNLGSRYSELGRRIDALEPTERAVAIRERLAAENPAFLNDLASALNNLGICYSEVGRRTDAIGPTQRAVEIYERLAAENPAFLNDLARSLNNLGNRYSQIGRRADAIPPAERAVDICERLAADNPAFLNDLARSLNSLGNRYSQIGRRTDALAPTERAVAIYERLAAENPAFLNDLASTLSNLGIRYSEVGRRTDAVEPTQRAVDICERLAANNPAFLNDLASSLANLGVLYSGVARRADAVEPTERASAIYERLAAENPAFLNDLARALNNLGVRYSEVGRHADAVAPTERAIAIRERLAAENPAFLNDLASALNTLGNHYSHVGRHADAVAPTQRAVDIYEALAAENPAFLNDLAMSLNNLGKCYGEGGRGLEADGRWAGVLERLAGDATASIVLRVRRARPERDAEKRLDDLFEALALDQGEEPRVTADLHGACRSLRARRPAEFDAAWRRRLGDTPDWLLVDEQTIDACTAWITTSTWVESRDFLHSNPDGLLSDPARTALEELALANPEAAEIPEHLALLDACRTTGIDSAYRERIIGETVATWRSLDDPAESRRYLLDHRDALFTPEAAAHLEQSEDTMGWALLTLAKAGEVDRAYDLLTDPEARAPALVDTRRHGPPERLHALALLSYAQAGDDAERLTAVLHLAIGLALEYRPDDAVEVARSIIDGETSITPLVRDVTDAITHHPEHAANLARLIRALTEDPAE